MSVSSKTYSCGICKTTPDQISHHKTHLETQKHKDKRDVFEFKLSKLSPSELEGKYKTSNIHDIIRETETLLYNHSKKLNIPTHSVVVSNTKNSTNKMNSEMQMIEHSNNVSNKEALKEKIHEIHNFLRNNGAGYGMNALKVFNIIYGLKKIEENGLLDKVSLKKPDCVFSYLLQLANQNKDEHLAELIFGNVLQSICDSELKALLFYEIPVNIKGSVFSYLIKEIDKITIIEKTCNVLLSGKIYEYFIGRDESAISELGAYFTDRHIVDYILRKLDPVINDDDTIPTMIDMFGGSGGFTTGYIHYLKNKYPSSIDWTTEINKISHFDMNEDVIKSAGLEFFCLTGVLPNMDNLKYKNSFTDEFNGQRYKYPLTNPPYGGDKTSKTEAQNKREKVKEYIKAELLQLTDEGLRIRRQKQLKSIELQEKIEKKDSDKTKVSISMCSGRIQKFAKDNNLKGNDKESCSLMLLMDILDVGGTAIGVLKEGVFFNKTYKDIRKCLIENYNVREVISVPQDQFENTSTKTSIVIFDNTVQKTTRVQFRDLNVERYMEDKFTEVLGEIIIVENKGDIVGVNDVLVATATKDEIAGHPICSLNGKDYGKKEMAVHDDYKWVKLGDICEFLPKSKRNASFGQPAGTYNFYTSSEKVQKCDIADYNEECLIIGSGGVANIKMDTYFSCSADNLLLTAKNNTNIYLYNLFKGNMALLSDGFTGSALKHLSKDYLINLPIPIPKSPEKIQEWIHRISIPYNEVRTKQFEIQDLESLIGYKMSSLSEYTFKSILELTHMLPHAKHNTSFGKPNGKYKFYNSSNEEKLFCDEYEIEDESIIIGFKGNINIHFGKQFTASQHMYVVQLNTQTISEFGDILKYVYYYLKNNDHLFTERMHGTTIKHITKNDFQSIQIKIPQNKILIQEFNACFQKMDMLQMQRNQSNEMYKECIQALSQEAMPYM